MARFPHPRSPGPEPSKNQQVLRAVPRQGASLAIAAARHSERPQFDDVVIRLRKHLPHREQADTDPFLYPEVDSVIDGALNTLVARRAEVEAGHGVAIALDASRGKQLFEATIGYLTEALHAPVAIPSEEKYIEAMHDTTDRIEHFPLAEYGFNGYIDPAMIAQFLENTFGTSKMAWVQQTNGKDELYIPTEAGVWLDIRTDTPPLKLATVDGTQAPAAQNVPEILLVVPSVGK